MYKVCLIERYSKLSFFWENLLKKNKLTQFTVEQVINKYKGFEGNVIEFCYFDDIHNNFEEKLNQCKELQQLSNCLLLHVFSQNCEIPFFVKNSSQKIGYDVGICEFEGMFYSSIFNEVLFGNVDELISYKDFLNENLLFQDRSLAEQYVDLHQVLDSKGKNVEHEEMIIYEIWKQKNFK